MTVDKGKAELADWVLAMRSLKPDRLITIKTNEGELNSADVDGVGSVEKLTKDTMDLLKAIKKDRIDNFLLSHPKFVSNV